MGSDKERKQIDKYKTKKKEVALLLKQILNYQENAVWSYAFINDIWKCSSSLVFSFYL